MLKAPLLHPAILSACARAGHHSRILIADGNYPVSSKRGPNSEIVCLQLTEGIPTVAQVLEVLLAALPVDSINTMGVPPDDPYARFGEPEIWKEFRRIAFEAGNVDVSPIDKWEFYDAVNSPDHVLTIQTGDTALWANVMITIGCRTPG